VLGLLLAAALAALNPLNLSALVNPFVGTSGTVQGGPIDTFPGADVPFGMVQWSPDTPSQDAGGGYDYNDRAITGFSVTHLSGPGCNVFGDFAMLPTVGAVTAPAQARLGFSHQDETAQPGWYAVKLDNGARVSLTVTQRTGLGSFTFAPSTQSNILINASSDQAGVFDASIHVKGPDEVTGSATSGGFCGMPDTFTVYFVALFDRPFGSYGTWRGARVSLGSALEQGPGSGAWVTFDTTSNSVVKAKVAISYVSVQGAIDNLRTENPGWDLDAVRAQAQQLWNGALGRIQIAGGTTAEQTTFYTALYHALLHPNVYSDADGTYRGFDGRVHRVRPGHVEYANYSDWDIYRTEMPLLALIEPHRASDMAQSLVDAAEQGGLLPRWALVNEPTGVMGGDSVDPVIAGAYAFGARNFDVRAALKAMVRGASDLNVPREDGWYVERPQLSDYLSRGYVVNTHTTSVAPVPNGASETLEYALDDFSIAQLALAVRHTATYRTFMRRSSNWANLFDTATSQIAPRDADGAFMNTPITDAGQSGFQEGNSAQYTWMVPQDLNDLIEGIGGAAAASAKLDLFFTKLDAGQNEPYAWLGNEPSLGSPWVYLSIGEPWRSQEIVRSALLSLYGNSPAGLPGNDDLGTMSAWYVWCALGLYPQNPAVRRLVIGSPLFTRAVISSPDGPTITIDARNAADDAPYVQSLKVNAVPSERTWIDVPLRGNVALSFTLGAAPDKSWGSAPGDAPPSYAIAPVHFPPSANVGISVPTSVTPITGTTPVPLSVSFSNAETTPVHISWRATGPSDVRVQPSSGTVNVPAKSSASATVTVTSSPASSLGSHFENLRFDATANGVALEHAVGVIRIGPANVRIPLGFIENIYDNSVSPIDLSTGTLLPKISAGDSPRDGTFGSDGMLYVCDRDGNAITVIDPTQLQRVKTIKVGNGPSGITLGPGGMLWFVNAYDGTLQAIDPKTMAASPPIVVGGTLRDLAIVGQTAYVTVSSYNEVLPVDLRTKAVGQPIAVGESPQGIAATPDGKMLYVADRVSNDVTPIELSNDRPLRPIPVGVAPASVAVGSDGRVVYVSNGGVDTVTPIDARLQKALPPIRTGGMPYGLAISGSTLWVVNREDNDVVPVDLTARRAGTPILDGYGPLTIVLPL
jgi:predicted alpha-1,2-mannosidase